MIGIENHTHIHNFDRHLWGGPPGAPIFMLLGFTSTKRNIPEEDLLTRFSKASREVNIAAHEDKTLKKRFDAWRDVVAKGPIGEKERDYQNKAKDVADKLTQLVSGVDLENVLKLQDAAVAALIGLQEKNDIIEGVKSLNALVKRGDLFLANLEGQYPVTDIQNTHAKCKQARYDGRKVVTLRSGCVILKDNVKDDVERFLKEAKKAHIPITGQMLKSLKELQA